MQAPFVVLTDFAVVPKTELDTRYLGRHGICPCQMGVMLMRETEFLCSCETWRSHAKAWRAVLRAMKTGRFSL